MCVCVCVCRVCGNFASMCKFLHVDVRAGTHVDECKIRFCLPLTAYLCVRLHCCQEQEMVRPRAALASYKGPLAFQPAESHFTTAAFEGAADVRVEGGD